MSLDRTTKTKTSVAVIGATGFIGRHFVSDLLAGGIEDIRILVRNTEFRWPEVSKVSGSLQNQAALGQLIRPGCVVVNLARPGDGYGHLVNGLIEACRKGGASRLIHCSSIDVYGRAPETPVTERTVPVPDSRYALAHYSAEQAVMAVRDMEAAVLRPGAVFGAGGRNLVGLAKEIMRAPGWKLAARRMLQGRQRMHLVAVETVAAALRHLCLSERIDSDRMFVVTDDEVPENDFAGVQDVLATAFDRDARAIAPPMPPAFLSAMLRVRGRFATPPRRRFDTAALGSTGFVKPVSFGERLAAYAAWLAGTLRGAD